MVDSSRALDSDGKLTQGPKVLKYAQVVHSSEFPG